MSDETRTEYYRQRADSARTLASKLRSQAAKRKWGEIADRYDYLANMTKWILGRRNLPS